MNTIHWSTTTVTSFSSSSSTCSSTTCSATEQPLAKHVQGQADLIRRQHIEGNLIRRAARFSRQGQDEQRADHDGHEEEVASQRVVKVVSERRGEDDEEAQQQGDDDEEQDENCNGEEEAVDETERWGEARGEGMRGNLPHGGEGNEGEAHG